MCYNQNMPEEKRLSPGKENPPPVAEKTLPPPPEVVWLDKGYTPPAHEPRKSFVRLFGFGDNKKEPGDTGGTFEKDSSDKPKILADTSAVATAIPPPPPEVVWLGEGYASPPRKSILRLLGLGDDKKNPPPDTGGDVEFDDSPPPQKPKSS